MPSTNAAPAPQPDPLPIDVQDVDVLPRGEISATLTVGGIAMGARFRPGGRAPALVALNDDELRGRVEDAILAAAKGMA